MCLDVGSYVHDSRIIEIIKDRSCLRTYYKFECSCGRVFTRRDDSLHRSIMRGIRVSCGCQTQSKDSSLLPIPKNAITLKEMISKLPDDIIMHMGASEGGWVFIGNKAKFKKFANETNKYLNRKVIERYNLSDRGHIGVIISGTTARSRRYWFEYEYDQAHGLEVK